MADPKRGDVFYVDLEPVKGSEQGGRRPCLVIQNDVSNAYSPVVIVAAITSRPSRRDRPTDALIAPDTSGLDLPSRVMFNQIRTIDKSRLGRYVGHITNEELSLVDEAIRVSLGLTPL